MSRGLYICLWEIKIINLELLAHQRILLVETTQLVSNMTSHTALAGHGCDVIVLKVHLPTKDKKC
jgi:hypothetical protein